VLTLSLLGEQIATKRTTLGLTQSLLAKKAGLDVPFTTAPRLRSIAFLPYERIQFWM
jgi:transcriptional regulator with XRE-family HTH domain